MVYKTYHQLVCIWTVVYFFDVQLYIFETLQQQTTTNLQKANNNKINKPLIRHTPKKPKTRPLHPKLPILLTPSIDTESYCRVNNMGEHIVEKTDLPDELISQAAGSLGFQDTQPRVCTSITSLVEIRNMVEDDLTPP